MLVSNFMRIKLYVISYAFARMHLNRWLRIVVPSNWTSAFKYECEHSKVFYRWENPITQEKNVRQKLYLFYIYSYTLVCCKFGFLFKSIFQLNVLLLLSSISCRHSTSWVCSELLLNVSWINGRLSSSFA